MIMNTTRSENRLLYEYIRGSQLYGLNTETSDVDTGGVFICRHEELLGMGESYQDCIQENSSNDTWFELKKYFTQLQRSSPEVLESLFVPDHLVLRKNPILENLFKNRDMFLTQACFKPFANYALSQIKKAQGLNKMISVEPKEIEIRKTPLHFCFVIDGYGTIPLLEYLEKNNLDQNLCGLSRLPNFFEGYSLFYDDSNSFSYRGLISPDSTQLKLSSIPKGEKPRCCFQYSISSFVKHCTEFKTYQDWVKNRNQERFNLNKGYNFDSKNMCHCVRLIIQAKEIAEGKGLRLDRSSIDRDFLLSIKNHEITYENLMIYVQKIEEDMHESFLNTKIPKSPPSDFLEKELIRIRKSCYGINND